MVTRQTMAGSSGTPPQERKVTLNVRAYAPIDDHLNPQPNSGLQHFILFVSLYGDFAPLLYWFEFVERFYQASPLRREFSPGPLNAGLREASAFRRQFAPVGATEFVVLVTKVLPGVPQKQPAVFDVTRRKHG
jgi:hypothetical protein